MTAFVLPLVDGARNFGADSPWGVVAGSRAAQVVGFVPPPVEEVAGEPVAARVNHNRWIADCPDCPGAEFVWRDGPLVMLCLACLNGGIGHRWRRVLLPPDLPAIEAALLARPLPATRNWATPETVADLLAENAAEGVGRGV